MINRRDTRSSSGNKHIGFMFWRANGECQRQQSRNFPINARYSVWKLIRVQILSICFLAFASISHAHHTCPELRGNFETLLIKYRELATLWENQTGSYHAVPSYPRAKFCDDLEKDFASLRTEYNTLSEKLRTYKGSKANQAKQEETTNAQRLNQENKAIQEKIEKAQTNFSKRMDQVDKFLNEEQNNSQSPQTKLKTALDHLRALRDLSTEGADFPPPWDIPETHLPMPVLDQPIGGKCTCP